MKAGTKKAKKVQQAQEAADKQTTAIGETLFVANLKYLLEYLKANPNAKL